MKLSNTLLLRNITNFNRINFFSNFALSFFNLKLPLKNYLSVQCFMFLFQSLQNIQTLLENLNFLLNSLKL